MLGKSAPVFSRFLLLMLLCADATPVLAFPPYRSTDADTAPPDTLELRVGFIKLENDKGETELATPLWRANLGFPNKLELISEFDYVPEKGTFGDVAAGIKWVPWFGGALSFGNETLFLLPLRPGDSGVGIESQFLATFWREDLQVHFNAGGFHDPRGRTHESGWRGSVLAEFPREGFEPGVEFFAKQVGSEPVDLRAGIGIIFDAHLFEVRSGAHAGLTKHAPDISVNFWFARAISF